jgi:CheY-like chemotaxis protein
VNTLRILVVEDEVVVARLVECLLQDRGCEVCGVAGSETGALELAELTRPTHAVIDVRLGEGDGRRVARELRRKYNTAVVFCTAYNHQVYNDKSLPPAVCLAKPYDPEHLVPALKAARQIADGELPTHLPYSAVRVGGAEPEG